MPGAALRAALWLAVAAPALYQVGLLLVAIVGRVGYPYDLEWMEGGMLHHAQRIRDGLGIYVPPSVDFIPYLYTPLYPAILALLGGVVGISYAVARAISVLALVGIAAVAVIHLGKAREPHAPLAPRAAGVALALGLFAAAYPVTDGWYDLVRADALFLSIVTAAIAGLPRWSRSGAGLPGHARVAAGAVMLALAVLCKQTGIFYVALGGAIVLVRNWRRVPMYVAASAIVGLGTTWILQRTTGGWFWTYVSEIHRAHDFSLDRFWRSFANLLWQPELGGRTWPPLGAAISIAIALSACAVLAARLLRKRWPRQAAPFALWTAAYAVSIVVGAIGWGTEFAHWNAYMPALLHGALAAGAAVPAMYASAQLLAAPAGPPGTAPPPRATGLAVAASAPVAGVLAAACALAVWQPSAFVPTADDEAAGDRLIARIRRLDGEVWLPSHPWYAHLAGKTPYAHRMGILDVTWRRPGATVAGLEEALARRAFTALILDDRDLHVREVPQLSRYYRPAFELPRTGRCTAPCVDLAGLPCACEQAGCEPPQCRERPRVRSGARVEPDSIWMPVVPAAAPAGARVVFDFEHPTWAGWTASGGAWGPGPVTEPVPGQELVLGATGARFATSRHGGARARGRVTSPEFRVTGARLTLRLGGGADAQRIRAELLAEDASTGPYGATTVVRTASVLLPGGDTLREVTLDVSNLRGKPARLVLVDDSETSHLVVDDVWLWP
jgi:hypothetical protein